MVHVHMHVNKCMLITSCKSVKINVHVLFLITGNRNDSFTASSTFFHQSSELSKSVNVVSTKQKVHAGGILIAQIVNISG